METIYEKYSREMTASKQEGGWFSSWFKKATPANIIGKLDLEGGNEGEK